MLQLVSFVVALYTLLFLLVVPFIGFLGMTSLLLAEVRPLHERGLA
jgi:hypothetical protein